MTVIFQNNRIFWTVASGAFFSFSIEFYYQIVWIMIKYSGLGEIQTNTCWSVMMDYKEIQYPPTRRTRATGEMMSYIKQRPCLLDTPGPVISEKVVVA